MKLRLAALLLLALPLNVIAADIPLGILDAPYEFQRDGESQATYTVVHVSKGKGGTVISINTRYSAASGWSYTRRATRCADMQTRTMASADTYEDLKKSKPDPQWADLVTGSSAYFVARKACQVAGQGF
jgi:hypothetical protein